jgi:hypothetical protein
MWTNRTLNQGQARPITGRRWLALCVAVIAVLPIAGSAQAPPVVVLKSGLHSVPGGDELLFTIAEVGSSRAKTAVTIEFRDASNRQRAFFSGTLQLLKPAQLRLRVPPTVRFEAFRVIAKLNGLEFREESTSIVTLEDIDVDSFRVVTKGGGCSVAPWASYDPMETGDPQGDCDGWSLTWATSFQGN